MSFPVNKEMRGGRCKTVIYMQPPNYLYLNYQGSGWLFIFHFFLNHFQFQFQLEERYNWTIIFENLPLFSQSYLCLEIEVLQLLCNAILISYSSKTSQFYKLQGYGYKNPATYPVLKTGKSSYIFILCRVIWDLFDFDPPTKISLFWQIFYRLRAILQYCVSRGRLLTS